MSRITEEALYRLHQAFWKVVGTEWSENWKAWPHCNGQAGCWTHNSSRWCACECRWCEIARKIRPGYHNDKIPPGWGREED